MRCASAVASGESNRHNSTLVACSEKSAKLTPVPSHVAPNGRGRPGHTLMHGSPRVGFDSLCRSGRPRVVLRIVSKLDSCPFYRSDSPGAQPDRADAPREPNDLLDGLREQPRGWLQVAGARPLSTIRRNGPRSFEKASR